MYFSAEIFLFLYILLDVGLLGIVPSFS